MSKLWQRVWFTQAHREDSEIPSEDKREVKKTLIFFFYVDLMRRLGEMCVWSSRMRSRQQHCMWQRHFICCLFEWKMTDCDPIRPPVSGPRERAGEYEETSAAARINLLHQIKLAGINPHQMGRMCREHSSVRKPRQDVCLSGEWGSPQDQDGCQRRQSACRCCRFLHWLCETNGGSHRCQTRQQWCSEYVQTGQSGCSWWRAFTQQGETHLWGNSVCLEKKKKKTKKGHQYKRMISILSGSTAPPTGQLRRGKSGH